MQIQPARPFPSPNLRPATAPRSESPASGLADTFDRHSATVGMLTGAFAGGLLGSGMSLPGFLGAPIGGALGYLTPGLFSYAAGMSAEAQVAFAVGGLVTGIALGAMPGWNGAVVGALGGALAGGIIFRVGADAVSG